MKGAGPLAAALLLGGPALALDLAVPGDIRFRETSPLAVHSLAIGPVEQGTVPVTSREGAHTRLIWGVDSYASSTALLAQFREQIQNDGFEVAFSCATQSCGGYDFRFGIEVEPAPTMFVDLSDFHYLTATNATDDAVLSLLVSRAGTGYMVQMDVIGGATAPPALTVTKSTRIDASGIGATLRAEGVAILDDVVFDTGSASLAATKFTSLEALAQHLAAAPGDAVALVGHTDAEGDLEPNVVLSEARAEAVRQYLITKLGVSEDQVAARGIGFLAPRASNLTREGRAQNRRVEVILTKTAD